MNTTLQTDIGSLGPIVSTVIRKLENPALAKRTRDREITLETRDGEQWVADPPRVRETCKRVCTNKGKPKNRHAKAWATLSPHDREDVSQTVAMVLCRHGMLSPGAWVIGKVPYPVWLEIFSECRATIRIDRKYERNALRFEAMERADFLEIESDSRAYLTRDRAKIARYARFYRDMLKAARDRERRQENRKAESNYKRYRAFLMASLRTTLYGDGWGELLPDNRDAKSAENFRVNLKRKFLTYVQCGILELDTQGKDVFRSLSELPAFIAE